MKLKARYYEDTYHIYSGEHKSSVEVHFYDISMVERLLSKIEGDMFQNVTEKDYTELKNNLEAYESLKTAIDLYKYESNKVEVTKEEAEVASHVE